MIYEILCNETGQKYYGSTYKNNRLLAHKCSSNNTMSKSIIERGNYTFKIIEKLNNPLKNELLLKEKEYILNNDCINKYSPLRTIEEKKNQNIKTASNFYYNNKENILTCRKLSYNNNKENISNMRKIPLLCKCGSQYTFHNKSRHEKTKKHKNYILSSSLLPNSNSFSSNSTSALTSL